MINHNSCIKLVRLIIFIYDARSHIHQNIVVFLTNFSIRVSLLRKCRCLLVLLSFSLLHKNLKIHRNVILIFVFLMSGKLGLSHSGKDLEGDISRMGR